MNRKSDVWYASVIVLHEQDLVMMDASTPSAFEASALSILRGRLAQGWYDLDDDFLREARRVSSKKDGEKAWQLLLERKDAELERIELVQVSTRYESEPFSGDEQ